MECPQNLLEIITVGASAAVILGAIFTTFAFLFKEIKGIEVKLSAEIKEQSARSDKVLTEQSIKTDLLVAEMRSDIKEQSARSDRVIAEQSVKTDLLITEIRSDIKEQAARSDQLYTMFIDLLKELRPSA